MSAAEKLDETLLALADPARRRVIDLLRESPRRAGELAAELDMVPPAMSRHLRLLRTSGLVEEESLPEDARVRVYRLRPEPFDELQDWLDEIASFWDDQLQAFKVHVERATHRERPEPNRRVNAKRPRSRRKRGLR